MKKILRRISASAPLFLLLLLNLNLHNVNAIVPTPASETKLPVQLGQRAHHKKFGPGIILAYEGQGVHARVQVNFENVGTKWLVLSYANLELK